MSILARSLYKDLAAQGYSERDVVSLATALIGEVTDHNLRQQRAQEDAAAQAMPRFTAG